MSKVVHFEIVADEPEKLAKFYTDTFDWKIEEWKREGVIKEENRYWMIMAGPKEEIGANGGMYKRQIPIAKGGVNAFVGNIAVTDIEKAAMMIKENGGKVQEIMDIPDVGKSAAAEDPDGNNFAIFQADPNAKMQNM
ncbi:MAG: VOC family protein [bacterium]